MNDGELNNYVNAQHIRHVKAREQFVLHSEGSTKAAKTWRAPFLPVISENMTERCSKLRMPPDKDFTLSSKSDTWSCSGDNKMGSDFEGLQHFEKKKTCFQNRV